MKSPKYEISESLLRVLNKFLENQKKPRNYGLDELLYPSEVHTIMLIGQNPGTGVTEIASKCGITKGAVSQMVYKLEQKELISKETDPVDNKRVSLKLTNKGKIAFYSHERMHEKIDKQLLDFLDNLKPGQHKLLQQFLLLIESGIDKRK